MIGRELLLWVAVALAAVAAAATAGVLLGAAWRAARSRMLRGRVDAAAAMLAAHVAGTAGLDDAGERALGRLPRSIRVGLVVRIARSVSGEDEAGLAPVATRLGVVRDAEALVRSRFWWRRLTGVRVLAAVRAEPTALDRMLRDRHPLVRAEAAEWASVAGKRGSIDRLARLLDDADGLCRFTAKDALVRLGEVAAPSIRWMLEEADGRALLGSLEVAAAVPNPIYVAPACRLAKNPAPIVRAWAARVLGGLGGGRAERALVALLDDDTAEVRAAAATALGRLQHWPSAPRLAALLEDRAWLVRRAAGLGLKALGAPGTLFLRRAIGSDDPFASDMATQVLDISELDSRLSVAR